MNIVFTMAGKYSRFKLFGAKVPKYLLPLGQSTILDKVIHEIKICGIHFNYYFIANRDDQLFYPILRSIFSQHDIPHENLIYIENTSSQLETAIKASELIEGNSQIKPICFANIDTVVRGRGAFFDVLKKMPCESALLDTFNGRSSKYSYARSDEFGNVLEVVDQNIVSEFACSGLYGFGSFEVMRGLAAELLKENNLSNFTTLYNLYIKKDLPVQHVHSERMSDTVVLGTPEEYVINIHKFIK